MNTVEHDQYLRIVEEYNKILREHPLFKEHLVALQNWDLLRQECTGFCTDCGKKAKTHLHHLNKKLRIGNPRPSPADIWYLPVKNIVYLSPSQVIESTLDRMNIKNSIPYYSVSRDEVVEVCPSCHRKRHSKK